MQHNLREVLHVHDSDVSGSHFANTKLADARFQNVNLRGSKFTDADLSGGQFDDVNLSNVAITNANLSGMRIGGILVTELLRAHRAESERASALRPFHIAFPVDDLGAARHFYGSVLGCAEGRSAAEWIDFDLFGHQIVAHLKPAAQGLRADPHHNPVDGHDVPVPHFGVVLSPPQWRQLAERLRAAGVRFIIEPYTRFAGQVGEQSTMFLLDPAGNALEFKAFADLSQLFAAAAP
jgi:extradiol dioxygenase family protein